MCSDIAIKVDNISKKYTIYSRPIDKLWDVLGISQSPGGRSFAALENVSFELKRGEVLGIVGCNGAGKSTLLQLICGILQPTTGSIQINGRIAALLELGAGFNLEFTGRENIYLNASVLGLKKDEIDSEFEKIVNFSELRDFIDQPVKTYSSGMLVRLAFSIATSIDPDILIIDEALSVGDGLFAKKSFDKIMKLKKNGTTILFCSHATYQVEALCDKAIWIEKGKIKLHGKSSEVISSYSSFLNRNMIKSEKIDNRPNLNQEISVPTILSANINQYSLLKSASDLIIEIQLEIPEKAHPPTVGILITNSYGIQISSALTYTDNFQITQKDKKISCKFPKIKLYKGSYIIDIFLMCEKAIHVYQHIRSAAEFEVEQKDIAVGLVELEHEWY